MSGYAIAATWLLVVSIILSAPTAIVWCFRDEQRKDTRARIEFAPLHRDAAAHEAWARTFAEDADREWQAITDAVENRGPR